MLSYFFPLNISFCLICIVFVLVVESTHLIKPLFFFFDYKFSAGVSKEKSSSSLIYTMEKTKNTNVWDIVKHL